MPSFLSSFRTMAGPQGVRPAALLEPRPQGEVQRHAGIGYELAQNLDVPVVHMEQLPDVLQFFATCLPVVAEQVIDVPKISQDRTQQRLGTVCVSRRRRTSWWKCPTIMEQNVDIPVPGGGGRTEFNIDAFFGGTHF